MIFREYLKAIPKSFYSGQLYCEVAKNWAGFCIFYIAALVVLGMIPVSIGFKSQIGQFYDHKDPLIEQMPSEMRVKNGLMSVTVKQPHIVVDTISARPFLTIDTSNSATTPNSTLVLRERGIEIRTTEKPPYAVIPYTQILEAFALPTTAEYTITHADLNKWAEMLNENSNSLMVIYYLLHGFLLTTSLIFRALVFSLLASGIATSLKVKLDYPAIFRISAVAVTPVALLEMTGMTIGNSLFVNDLLIYFLMQAAYCYFAIDSVRKYKH